MKHIWTRARWIAIGIVLSTVAVTFASWTVPRTWVHGELVTETLLNTHLRDNLNALTQQTTTITTTGTQTALAIPSGRGDLVIFANNATLLDLQGITAGYDGQLLSIYSIGAGRVDIDNQNGSASAANRIITGTGTKLSLYAGVARIPLTYDLTATRWRVLGRDFETPEFDNGNSGTAITLDFTANGRTQTVTRTGNCTFTLTAPPSPGSMVVRMVHEASATAYTVTFSPAMKWANGSAPTWTNTSGAIDILSLYWDGAAWYGVMSPAFS